MVIGSAKTRDRGFTFLSIPFLFIPFLSFPMSTRVPVLTTGVFTQSDENALENKLILVFGTPEKLEKKERLAWDCYSKALQDCTSYRCLYILIRL